MIVAALVDLGVPRAVLADALASLNLTGFFARFGHRSQSGIVATRFDVELVDAQPERTFREVRGILERATLLPSVKARALAIFGHLAKSESTVHRMPLDEVHFHEVGAIDALCDVVASAAALDYLGADVVVSPLPMGRGFVKARHGVLPLPAPAVVLCLAGFPTYDAGIDRELVTPTGAAIVAASATSSSRWPSFAPEHVGWGAGTQSLPDRPNLLRVVLGTATSGDPAEKGDGKSSHVVLEANLDDATGELVAHCIDILMTEGALDVWVVPSTMKKGRPGLVLSCLCTADLSAKLSATMLRESTSIGVRSTAVSRTVRPRREVVVDTPYGSIAAKISEGDFGAPQAKPEFDDCARAAAKHSVPVREVIRTAMLALATQPGVRSQGG